MNDTFCCTRGPEEMSGIFKSELQFLETCLRGNPKSYGVWNHRCFIMETMDAPDWARELQLCNVFLEYDERNCECYCVLCCCCLCMCVCVGGVTRVFEESMIGEENIM